MGENKEKEQFFHMGAEASEQDLQSSTMLKFILTKLKPEVYQLEKAIGISDELEQEISRHFDMNVKETELMKNWLNKCSKIKQEISDILDIITEEEDKWFNMCRKMEYNAKNAEKIEYDRVSADTKGFIQISSEARIRVRNMKRRIKELKNLLEISNVKEESTGQNKDAFNSLPKLKLLNFDGNAEEWEMFISNFKIMVDSKSMPDVQKLCYLLGQLKGEPLKMASTYSVTAENYKLIMNELMEKYGNKQILQRNLLNKLQKIKFSKQNNRETIRSILTITAQLESSGINIDVEMMHAMIINVLPKPVYIKVMEHEVKNNNTSLSDLRRIMKDYLSINEAIEIYELRNKEETHLNTPKPNVAKLNQGIKKTSSFPAVDTSRTHQCAFCEKAHWSNQCDTFTDIDERYKIIKIKGLCYKCLNKNHKATDCMKDPKCYYCKQNHSSALCKNRKPIQPRGNADNEANETEVERATISTAYQQEEVSNDIVLLKCINGLVKNTNENKDAPTKVSIMFDSGSQYTFITENLATRLHLTRKKTQNLHISTFGSKDIRTYNSSKVNIRLMTRNNRYIDITAFTTPILVQSILYMDMGQIQKSQLNNRYINSSLTEAEPEILIGCNYMYQFIEGEPKKLPSGFTFIKTKLGDVLCGKGKIQSCKKETKMSSYSIRVEVEQENDMQQYWKLEKIGLESPTEQTMDEYAVEQYARGIQKDNTGRFETRLPWKSENPKVPLNLQKAVGRLKCVYKQLTKGASNKYLENYDQIIQKQIEDDIIERVNWKSSGITSYLPHQPVFTPHKDTTKLRIVYDASTKDKEGNSLNANLLRGPVLLNDLIGILLRSRTMKIVILADVEKAFHQIGLREEDRDVTRFLWMKNIENGVNNANLQVFRYKRIPFGLISSPFLLAATIWKHLESSPNSTVRSWLKNIYVDNLMFEANTYEQAKQVSILAKQVFGEIKMKVREFISNNIEFNNSLNTDEKIRSSRLVKLLGLTWDVIDDTYQIQTSMPDPIPMTKRGLLQFTMKIFDPMGWVGPVVLNLKHRLQMLWKAKYDWDDHLDEEDQRQINLLFSEWKSGVIKVPRYILNNKKYEIHCFCDASKHAYATSIYVRGLHSMGTEVNLLISKSKLQPLQGLTIPRAELMGVLIGTRLIRYIQSQLNDVDIESTIWTDSKIVLYWILNQSRVQNLKFVYNRLREIESLKATFRYVPSKDNPADIASRGTTIQELKNNSLWWNGPTWLKKKQQYWPQNITVNNDLEITSIMDREIKIPHKMRKLAVNVNITKECTPVIDITRYSEFTKLQRLMVRIIRFIKQASKKSIQLFKHLKIGEHITIPEMKIAEEYLIRYAQLEVSDKEKEKFELYSEEGLLRFKGRINQPLIFLPRNHHLTKLLVLKMHVELLHSCAETTICSFSERFWISKRTQTIKKIIKEGCMLCKRQNSNSFKLPAMKTLPNERIRRSRPFQFIGVDLAGPIWVETEKDKCKAWIVLFTCFSTRAIHMELVTDLTTNSFLWMFRKLYTFYGKPEKVISDNARNFKLAQGLLKELQKKLAIEEIEWQFIPQYAPWYGGLYERMIGLLKNVLRMVIRNRIFHIERMRTLLYEITSVVNKRPLCRSNDKDLKYIRPCDLIHFPQTNMISSQADFPDDAEYQPLFNRTKEQIISDLGKDNQMLNYFWKIWNQKYISLLREKVLRHKQRRGTVCRQPKIGEVVIIMDKTPRNEWKLARICELNISSDGKIRSVQLQLPNKTMTTRTVDKIAPLNVEE